jgi:spore coat protein H
MGQVCLPSPARLRFAPLLAFSTLLLVHGGASAAEARADVSRKSAGDELFTNTVIRHLKIEIPSDGVALLRKYRWRRDGSGGERADVSATVREGNLVWTNVALHLKGAAGSFRPVDTNPALTLNFDKFVDGQRFHGLQKISLNNSVQDPGYLSEKLCREVFAAAGVPVPRSDYAMVELNGRQLGLYVLAEGWNKQFLKRYFQNVDGNLYDGAFGRDINQVLPVNSGKNPEDQSELQALYAACTNRNLPARLTQLEKLLDLDCFYSLLALDTMMWNWDGYAINKNNYRLFHDRGSGRLVFMPHGLDQMFWKTNGPIVTGVKGAVARALLQIPEGRQRCLERIAQLRTNVLEVATLTRRVNELAERVRPSVAQSGFGAAFRHSAEVKILRDRIAIRAASIDEQLAGTRDLLKLEVGKSAALSGWKPRKESGNPAFETNAAAGALHIAATGKADAGAWATTVWLEEGTYRVTGRIKTQDLVVAPKNVEAGAGLRIWSDRKVTEGVHWSWFPFSESQVTETRGVIPPIKPSQKISGSSDWTEVTYEFELRQPIADLQILCEIRSGRGQASFDRDSLKITRTRLQVSSSGLPKS